MKLKRLEVRGFRSLAQLDITFDNSLTIVVGENDAGKTSLIECLKVIIQGRSVGLEDFTHGYNELAISIETDDFNFQKTYKKDGVSIDEEELKAYPATEYSQRTLERLNSYDPDKDQEFVREVARIFGLTVRSNSVIENLKNQLITKLTVGGVPVIEGASFPKFNSIQLDGRHFENVPAFFKEVFLKEKQANIWHEKISEDETIESFVRTHLDVYSGEVSKQIQERGIISKLRMFLPELTEVKVEPVFQMRDLSVDAKVKFLENGSEISIENKGDGTKRRMTMALLEFKKEQSLVPNDNKTIYLLDEPDTHLHVKAQLDLVETVESFSVSGSQVIMTTHSPFVLNAAKPSQVRLLFRRNGTTEIRSLASDPAHSSKILRSLGIENTHLFFSKKIVIVEGETEERFLPAQYLRQTGRMLSSNLIKVINTKGVQNIAGFAQAILELHDPEKIYILCDNDASPELKKLIGRLSIPDDHIFYVGHREFEDAFESPLLQRIWTQYHIDCNKQPPPNWTTEAIDQLKLECITDEKKFSEALRKLGQGGKALEKPIFGAELGGRADISELPERLSTLLNLLIKPA